MHKNIGIFVLNSSFLNINFMNEENTACPYSRILKLSENKIAYYGNTENHSSIVNVYENGQLVPDEIVVQLIEQKIENSKGIKGFIFKGFPRTIVQAYILDGLLQREDMQASGMIEMTSAMPST